jgi:short subunit dehydrogenase-like uncharacterized protein
MFVFGTSKNSFFVRYIINLKVIIMKRNALLIYMSTRKETAEKVQKILTAWGCYIKTRLGLHEGVLDSCTETGLVFIDLVGEAQKHEELTRKLNLVHGVHAELVKLEISI